jgi:hypothetical protein
MPAVNGITPHTKARAIHAYEPVGGGEHRLVVGDILTIRNKDADGWWHGSKEGEGQGKFPGSYVELL